MTAEPANREAWLTTAGQILMAELVAPHGAIGEVPAWAVTCSFPTARALSASNRRLGECWDKQACSDGVHHLFITPLLTDPVGGDGMGVLPTLVHELVHVVTWGEGHKGRFRQVAKAVGLEGKMTATNAGAALCEKLTEVASRLGPYPQGQLSPTFKRTPQRTRMVKVEAIYCCGYVCRTTRKWLDEVGTPRCSHGSPMEEVE